MNYFLCDLDKRGICFDPSSTLIFLNSDLKKKKNNPTCNPLCMCPHVFEEIGRIHSQ